MSGLDIFTWIVLIILVANAIAVYCIAGWLPGHIAKTRGHPQAQAVNVAGWVTLIAVRPSNLLTSSGKSCSGNWPSSTMSIRSDRIHDGGAHAGC
jgi:hypothetical protein